MTESSGLVLPVSTPMTGRGLKKGQRRIKEKERERKEGGRERERKRERGREGRR